MLVYFQGGGFRGGRKSVEARALLFHLARRGWATVSANYRLRSEAGYVDHLIDVKKVIAWIRAHGHEYGADPSTLFLSGGSGGGNLSSFAALTANERRYQPGFEETDTSVTGVASLNGWYGGYYATGGPDTDVGVLDGRQPLGQVALLRRSGVICWWPVSMTGVSAGSCDIAGTVRSDGADGHVVGVTAQTARMRLLRALCSTSARPRCSSTGGT